MFMINLNHPCYEVDLWEVKGDEEMRIAVGQGYLILDDVRKLVSAHCEGCGAIMSPEKLCVDCDQPRH